MKEDKLSLAKIEHIASTETTAASQYITLDPEQVEEINADEYSLLLFTATRTQPMTLLEIKRQFPEPRSKKAQSVMERFISVGLVKVDSENRYFTCFPNKYVNYAAYKYDAQIESKKDERVYREVKENMGKKAFWDVREYFTIDGFFTAEQTQELKKLFIEIENKAVKFSEENMKKGSLKGQIFRRLKFYDMISALTLVLFASLMLAQPSHAGGGTSGRPNNGYPASFAQDCAKWASVRDVSETAVTQEELACKEQALKPFVKSCEGNEGEFCKDVRGQMKQLWLKINNSWDL